MNRLVRMHGALDRISQKVGQATSWLALPIVFVIMLDVISRRFFAIGSVTLQELEWHFHAILFLFCAGYAYLHDSHVRVDLIRAKLSPRTQAWIELSGTAVFLLPFCLIMIYLGIAFVLQSWGLNEASDAPGGLPYRYLIKSIMPIAFFLLLLQGISVAMKQIVFLFGNDAKQGDKS